MTGCFCGVLTSALCEQDFPKLVLQLAQKHAGLEGRLLSLMSMIIINLGRHELALIYFLSHADLHQFIRLPFALQDEEQAIIYSRLLVSLANLLSSGPLWRMFFSRVPP